MKSRRMLSLVPILGMAMLLIGCHGRPYDNGYDMVLKNAGTKVLWGMNVEYPGFVRFPGKEIDFYEGKGKALEGAFSSCGPIPLPMASTVKVKWRRLDGSKHEIMLTIPKSMQPGPRDNIAFVFHDDDTVTVKKYIASDIAGAMSGDLDPRK
jgi:hypothetical protein